MSPAALLTAGLLVPAPPAAAAPAAAFTPADPAAVLAADPAPWWEPAARPAAVAVELGVDFSLARGQSEPPVRLLGLAEPAAQAAWLKQTSLLSSVLRSKGRLRADYWTDFDDTRRIAAQAVATTWVRNLLIDAEVNYWQQSRAPFEGDRLGGTWWTGDANAVLRVADHKRGRLRTGGGAAWILRDDGEAEVGYNGTVACDFGLLSNAVAGFEVDYGKIGDDDLFRWRVGGGWAFPGVEVRCGYDDFRIGREDREGVYAGVVVRY